jgi:hypothetical protein
LFILDPLDQSSDLVWLSVIDLNCDAFATGFVYEFGSFLDRLGPVHFGSLRFSAASRAVNGCAGGSEFNGDPASGAACGTGDECYLVSERLVHSNAKK